MTTDTNDKERLTALFALAGQCIDAEFAVLPAWVWRKPDGTLDKRPGFVHGHLEAHRDRQLIVRQLIDPPHRGPDVPDHAEVVVAFVPGSGGCGVLDCDVKNGKAGRDSFLALRSEYGDFDTAAWRSPSGGRNVLFRSPAGAAYSNRSPWTGIDVRANNGWVVAPGQSCSGGEWKWLRGGFDSASELPESMTAQLTPAGEHGRRATNAETVRFIEGSPGASSAPALQRFEEQLDEFRAAHEGSRHDALVRIVGWTFGMGALDLRDAMLRIKDAWALLTPGEGRSSEPDEVAAWVVGQEATKRPSAAQIDDYQFEDEDDELLLELIDWRVTHDPADDLIERYVMPGRWTQNVAPAKAGKSAWTMWCAIELSEGRDPVEGTPVEPVVVLYCDGEMGRMDLEQLIRDMGRNPLALPNLHCSEVTPRLDTPFGAEMLLGRVDQLGARLVVLDGLNGFIPNDADENTSSVWRGIFDCTVKPLKARSVAVLSNDNMGKDPSRGSRGSSAKNDKADGVVVVRKTDRGLSLHTTHGRAGAYFDRLDLNAEGFDRSKHIRYWRSQLGGWPAGTKAAVQRLDKLGVPVEWGAKKVRKAVRDAGESMSNEVIASAIRYRKAYPVRTPPQGP
jgi:hypothetical protein